MPSLPRLSKEIAKESSEFQNTAIITMQEYLSLLELKAVLNQKPFIVLKESSYTNRLSYVIVEENEIIKELIKQREMYESQIVELNKKIPRPKKNFFQRLFNL